MKKHPFSLLLLALPVLASTPVPSPTPSFYPAKLYDPDPQYAITVMGNSTALRVDGITQLLKTFSDLDNGEQLNIEDVSTHQRYLVSIQGPPKKIGKPFKGCYRLQMSPDEKYWTNLALANDLQYRLIDANGVVHKIKYCNK